MLELAIDTLFLYLLVFGSLIVLLLVWARSRERKQKE